MRRSSEQQPLVGFDNSGNRNGSPKTLFDRAIRWGISRKGGERSQRSIWERFPELGRLKENSPEKFPDNALLIPDGNGTWAKLRGLEVEAGHEAGADVIVNSFPNLIQTYPYIRYLGGWGLSVNNLGRPKKEVDYLMDLFRRTLIRLYPHFMNNNIAFIRLGRDDVLDSYPATRTVFEEIQHSTRNHTGLAFYIPLGFDGADQNLRIAQKIGTLVKEGKVDPSNISEELLQKLRDGGGKIPPADLIIRTSQERTSDIGWLNGKETELYFMPKKLFPDFGLPDFTKAIMAFSRRNRKFGLRSQTETFAGNVYPA